jgi:ferredoxin
MNKDIKLHPQHAKGKYYVDCRVCVFTATCLDVAPANFTSNEDPHLDFGAYVYRQPETDEEEAACREAMRCCPVEAIRVVGEEHHFGETLPFDSLTADSDKTENWPKAITWFVGIIFLLWLVIMSLFYCAYLLSLW